VPHQYPVELILLREFAARLAMPVAVFDLEGRLVYLNPATEALFGVDFASLGELSLADALAIAQRTDADGAPIPADLIPVGVTLGHGEPLQASSSIRDPMGRHHRLATTIPLQGQGDRSWGPCRSSGRWRTSRAGRSGSPGPPE